MCSLVILADRVCSGTTGNEDLRDRVTAETVTTVDTTGHLTGCIETVDSLSICIEHVTLYVHADTAHRVVGRRSEEADTKLRIVEVIGIGLVGAVLVFLTVADQCRELLVAVCR